jgi:hypothetical protein
MAEPMTKVRRSRARRIWTRVGLFGLAAVLLGGSLIAYLFVGFVPPIYGTLVDGVTGKPVPHMTILLEATAKDWESRKVMRSEETETGPSGTFFFPPSIYLLGVFQSWQGYCISIHDPTVRMEGEHAVRTEDSRPVYFQAVIAKERVLAGIYPYNASHRKMGFPLFMRVPLVPLLPSVKDCPALWSKTKTAYCREENNSWLADRMRVSGLLTNNR